MNHTQQITISSISLLTKSTIYELYIYIMTILASHTLEIPNYLFFRFIIILLITKYITKIITKFVEALQSRFPFSPKFTHMFFLGFLPIWEKGCLFCLHFCTTCLPYFVHVLVALPVLRCSHIAQ